MSRDDVVTEGPGGRIVLTGGALAAHAARAAATVDGVRVGKPRRALDVEARDDGLHLVVRLAAAGDVNLPEAGEAVQRAVAGAVTATTGRAVTVDVTIDEIEP